MTDSNVETALTADAKDRGLTVCWIAMPDGQLWNVEIPDMKKDFDERMADLSCGVWAALIPEGIGMSPKQIRQEIKHLGAFTDAPPVIADRLASMEAIELP